MASLEAFIPTIEQMIAALGTILFSVGTLIWRAARDRQMVEGRIEGLEEDLSEMKKTGEGRYKEAIRRLENVDGRLESVCRLFEKLNGSIDPDLRRDVAAVESRLSTVEARVSDVGDDVREMRDDIKTLLSR